MSRLDRTWDHWCLGGSVELDEERCVGRGFDAVFDAGLDHRGVAGSEPDVAWGVAREIGVADRAGLDDQLSPHRGAVRLGKLIGQGREVEQRGASSLDEFGWKRRFGHRCPSLVRLWGWTQPYPPPSGPQTVVGACNGQLCPGWDSVPPPMIATDPARSMIIMCLTP